jgi:hypothetical protein
LDRFYRRAHLFIDHRATRPAGHRARPCSACSESARGRQCHARQEDGRRRRSLASSRATGQRAASIEATRPARPSPPEASPATRMTLAAASVRTSPRRRGPKPVRRDRRRVPVQREEVEHLPCFIRRQQPPDKTA